MKTDHLLPLIAMLLCTVTVLSLAAMILYHVAIDNLLRMTP